MSLTWADDVTVYLQFHCYLNQNIYTAHLYMNMCVWDKNVKLNLWISFIFTHHKCRKRNGASNPKHRDVTGTNSQSDSSTHAHIHTYSDQNQIIFVWKRCWSTQNSSHSIRVCSMLQFMNHSWMHVSWLFDLQDGGVTLHDGDDDPVNIILQTEVDFLLFVYRLH